MDSNDPWLKMVESLSGKVLIQSLNSEMTLVAFAVLSESWLADLGWSFRGAGAAGADPGVEIGRSVMLGS
jgi:hypothetical protein